MHTLYQNKEKRDKRYRELQSQGVSSRRGTVRNQQLHPMYVEDAPDGDTGFGNTVYKTFWPVLYRLDW